MEQSQRNVWHVVIRATMIKRKPPGHGKTRPICLEMRSIWSQSQCLFLVIKAEMCLGAHPSHSIKNHACNFRTRSHLGGKAQCSGRLVLIWTSVFLMNFPRNFDGCCLSMHVNIEASLTWDATQCWMQTAENSDDNCIIKFHICNCSFKMPKKIFLYLYYRQKN